MSGCKLGRSYCVHIWHHTQTHETIPSDSEWKASSSTCAPEHLGALVHWCIGQAHAVLKTACVAVMHLLQCLRYSRGFSKPLHDTKAPSLSQRVQLIVHPMLGGPHCVPDCSLIESCSDYADVRCAATTLCAAHYLLCAATFRATQEMGYIKTAHLPFKGAHSDTAHSPITPGKRC